MPGKSNVAPWSVKGVERPTRDLARQSAQAAGQTVGAWIEQAIRAHGTLVPPPGSAPPPDAVTEILAAAQRAEVRSLEHGVGRVEERSSDMVIPVALKVQELAHRLVEIEQARVAGRTRPAPVEEPPPPSPEAESAPPPDALPELPDDFWSPPAPAAAPADDFPTPVPPADDRPAEPPPEPDTFDLALEAADAAAAVDERPNRRGWARPRSRAKAPRRSRFRQVVGRTIGALVALALGAGTSVLVLDHGELVGLPPRLIDDVAAGLDRAIWEGRTLAVKGETLAYQWSDEVRRLVEGLIEDATLSAPEPATIPPAEPTKAEAPKVETPQTETPKTETPKAEAPKGESEATTPAVPTPPASSETPSQTAALPPPTSTPAPASSVSPVPAATPTQAPPAAGAAAPSVTDQTAAFPTLIQPPAEAVPQAREAEDLEKSARQGDVKAQYELGVLAAQPETGSPDYGKAAYWFREAAVQGNASAQYNLGVLYEHGLGVGQDDVRALLWYHSAAEQGHARAQYNLGVFYAQGRGIPTDYAEAQRWFKKAADQGIAKAFYNLAILAESGLGAPANPAAARAFMSRAALLGDPEARAALADPSKRPAIKPDAKPDPNKPDATKSEAPKPSTEVIGAVQHLLAELGYDPGRIDGMLGDKTRQAIRKYQTDNGLTQTGLASDELLDVLSTKVGPTFAATAAKAR